MASLLLRVPPSARALTAIGDETARAVEAFFREQQATLFSQGDDPVYVTLADALRKQKWQDADAAELIASFANALASGRSVNLQQLTRWILAHDEGSTADTIRECIEIEPPREVEILKVLSRKGSQKVVFLASWRLAQQEVVLKRVIGDSAERILSRELQLHPLTMVHPNIIETHFLENSKGERFLAEVRVRPLHDGWRANGLSEAANLLYDLTRATRFLHDNGRVHGDIKPDNIGIKNDRFLLLDFGICRPAEEFSRASTPTGSVRTRAPELLTSHHYIDPPKTDVWALGATVFNALAGRFPLIDSNEVVPRISTPAARHEFERELVRRIEHDWQRWVDLDSIQAPLRDILARMLDKDVERRPTSSELLARIEEDLPAFLRTIRGAAAPASRFSPHEDFEQIAQYLRAPGHLELLPRNRQHHLAERLRELQSLSGFSQDERNKMTSLIDALEGPRN